MKLTKIFLRRTVLKAMMARAPEFAWTFFAFFVTNATYQYWFGDGPTVVSFFGFTLTAAAIWVAFWAAIVSDLVPGSTVFILNEIMWERKVRWLYNYSRDQIAYNNWLIEND
jgi:hypothetical protein